MKSLLEFQRFGFLLGLIIVALTFQIYYAYRSRRSDQVYNGNGKDEGALIENSPSNGLLCRARSELADAFERLNSSTKTTFIHSFSPQDPTTFSIYLKYIPKRLSRNHFMRFEIPPTSLFPPEDIVVSVSSESIHFTARLRPCESVNVTSMEPRFYSASVQIPHSGSYSLSVSVVAEAFRWNAYNESNIWPWKRLEKAVLNVDGDTVIKVEVLKGGSGKSASNTCDLARIYNATNVIQKGWPLSELLPGYWAQLPNDAVNRNEKGRHKAWIQNTKPLLTGSTFIPTQCSLRAFTAHQGRMCLIEKYPVIHWFGDSNSRRAIKFLDVRDGGWRGFLGKDGREVCEDGNGGWFRDFALGKREIVLGSGGVENKVLGKEVRGRGKKAKIYFRGIGGSLTNAVFSWRRVLDRSDWWNVVSMSLKRREKVSLVVVSVGNWEAAFEDVDGWSERVRAFARGLKEMYREMEGVRFVFRTAQPACPVTEWGQYRHRRYTPARNEMFRTLGAMIFKEELNADIWDIGIVNSNQDMCEQFHCPSNHAHPSVVALENQLLFNLIC